MASRLTVIFYIILCLEAGIVLTVLPWLHPFGLGDWSDNYFLLYASQKIGLHGLQQTIGSGWVRGAVTGLGLLNLAMAFWEMAHFRQTVRRLDAEEFAPARTPSAASNVSPAQLTPTGNPPAGIPSTNQSTPATNADAAPTRTDDLSHHRRVDDSGDHSVE